MSTETNEVVLLREQVRELTVSLHRVRGELRRERDLREEAEAARETWASIATRTQDVAPPELRGAP